MENKLLQFISKIGTGAKGSKDLSYEEAYAAMQAILEGNYHPVTLGAFTLAERWKPETAVELAAFADAMADRIIYPQETIHPPNLINCAASYNGKSRTFNFALPAALVTAAAGVPVVIHGAQDIPTKKGMTTSHLLSELGINLNRTPDQSLADVQHCNIGYLHQPVFNPDLFRLLSDRCAIGKRTFFNTIEPIANPLGAKVHLGGFVHRPFGELICRAVQASRLGFERVVMVCGIEGADEIRPGRSLVVELKEGETQAYYVEMEELGLHARNEDTETASREKTLMTRESMDRTLSLLNGDVHSGFAHIVLVNAALRLYAAGMVSRISEGVELARTAVTSGGAMTVLSRWKEMAGV